VEFSRGYSLLHNVAASEKRAFSSKRRTNPYREELKKSAEANRQIAEDTKANAIVDLYQTYTNDYIFQTFPREYPSRSY
jgi:hypothetical protein